MLDRLFYPQKPALRRTDFYTVTVAPGVVCYLDFAAFCEADVESVIADISAESLNPTIEAPYEGFQNSDVLASATLDCKELDKLLPSLTWKGRLRIHHALGGLMIHEQFPSWVYVRFHHRLQLEAHVAIAECTEAWVKGTAKNWDLSGSYLGSQKHLVVEDENFRHGRAVFLKTPFVQSRLDSIANDEKRRAEEAARHAERARLEEEARKADIHAETLRRSRFTTFVYIMEDTRNKAFKIGRSRTPGKRERTLQSEVPETALRFSIPAEEQHEKALHARFAHRRIRGEWFELSVQDLVDAISFLKAQGDAERAEADFHWLGMIFFRAG